MESRSEEEIVNWKKWKMGLLVAFVTGLLTAGASISDDIRLMPIIRVFCVSLVATFGAYLKNHPVEEVQDGDPKI